MVWRASTWAKVIKHPDGGCWIWTGWKTKDGYGMSAGYTHRIVYEQLVGPIPEGMQLDHLCRVRACCNPDHLEPVSNTENSHRGISAHVLRTGACKRGHEYTPENTLMQTNRRRTNDGVREEQRKVCRTCKADRDQAYKERQQAKQST